MRFNGRNAYVPEDKRLCVNCTEESKEDEIHFLIKCSKYELLREQLFNQISAMNPFFSNYTDTEKFQWIMTTEQPNCIKHLSSFIANALAMRIKI